MSTTFIRKACPKCGHSASMAVHNYVGEPIGQPLSVCPSCGAIAWDSEHREWIQMSPVRKFYAILPQGIWYAPAITAGLTVAAIVFFRDAMDKLFSNTSEAGAEPLPVK